MSDEGRALGRRRSWNWWKIGFFVMLIVFELTREFAVLAATERAQPSALKTIFGHDGYVVARGRWLRSDGGSQIVPGTVTIECRRETGQCVEASVSTIDKSFLPPELDWFDATFTPDSVSYVNDNPACARYAVRIDLAQERAFATRDRKANPTNEMCAKMEERVAMELGDGYVSDPEPFKGHFVPLIQLVVASLHTFSAN
jgi:hypothetical protein